MSVGAEPHPMPRSRAPRAAERAPPAPPTPMQGGEAQLPGRLPARSLWTGRSSAPDAGRVCRAGGPKETGRKFLAKTSA